MPRRAAADLFRHADPNDPHRHRGWGRPLEGASWRTRPYHAGWLVGALWGDDLADGRLGQEGGLLGGYRLGWDFDHYWGLEGRFAFANLEISGSAPARTSRDWMWDAHLLYYPWGDARWRPFASVGLGAASFRFDDAGGVRVEETLLHLPFGVGVKYRCRPWLALRLSVLDNLAIGRSGLSTMHSLSLTGGVEVHWGGPPVKYWP